MPAAGYPMTAIGVAIGRAHDAYAQIRIVRIMTQPDAGSRHATATTHNGQAPTRGSEEGEPEFTAAGRRHSRLVIAHSVTANAAVPPPSTVGTL